MVIACHSKTPIKTIELCQFRAFPASKSDSTTLSTVIVLVRDEFIVLLTPGDHRPSSSLLKNDINSSAYLWAFH
ncbi:hypothetical protein DM784_17455 [Vibrio furnissii]|nr:hypothetical protein DM784_17455 [Vibrio furnissii]